MDENNFFALEIHFLHVMLCVVYYILVKPFSNLVSHPKYVFFKYKLDDIDEETDLERGFAGPSGRLSDILPDIEILTAQYRAYPIEILSLFCNIIFRPARTSSTTLMLFSPNKTQIHR